MRTDKEKIKHLLENSQVLADACRCFDKIVDLLNIHIIKFPNGKLYLYAGSAKEIDSETAIELSEVIDIRDAK